MMTIQNILIVILPLLVVGLSLVTASTLHNFLREKVTKVAPVPVDQDKG